jgi:DNA-binding transcriptional MocR family regulator
MSWAASPTLDQSPIVVSLRRELRQATGPLRDHLASGLLAAVGSGAIPLGSRLPAERRLAEALGVSRGTVVAALDQLEARGLVERRPGSGSYVRSAPITASGAPTPEDAELVELLLNHSTPIDLAVSSPMHPPVDLVPPEVQFTSALLTSTSEHGYSAFGEPRMRAAAAAHLTAQGLPSDASDVIITCGGQQALQLAIRTLVKPGDRVFVDSPTYPGLLALLRQAGAVPIPIRTDEAGIVPRDLTRGIAQHGPTMLASATLGSSPTGSVMSPGRRAELLDVIVAHELVVLEDLTLADTMLEDRLVNEHGLDASLVGAPLSADDRVRGMAVGSASKLLWGGLRVGWLRTNESWLRLTAQSKAFADFGTSPVTQLLTAEMLEHVHSDPSWLAKRRQQLRERRETMLKLLHHHLPTWRINVPAAGLSLWAQVPGVDGTDLAAAADRHDVHVIPGEQCGLDGTFSDHLRFTFDREPAVLEQAVQRMALAYSEVERTPTRSRTTLGP